MAIAVKYFPIASVSSSFVLALTMVWPAGLCHLIIVLPQRFVESLALRDSKLWTFGTIHVAPGHKPKQTAMQQAQHLKRMQLRARIIAV